MDQINMALLSTFPRHPLQLHLTVASRAIHHSSHMVENMARLGVGYTCRRRNMVQWNWLDTQPCKIMSMSYQRVEW
jgi:hypothetical protein